MYTYADYTAFVVTANSLQEIANKNFTRSMKLINEQRRAGKILTHRNLLIPLWF